MFCKKCGKKIDNDSVYCNYCGAEQKIQKNNNLVDEEDGEDDNKQFTKQIIKYMIVGIIIFFAFFVLLFAIVGADSCSGNDSDISLFTRELTSDDYTKTTQQDLTSYTIIITPKVDIKECVVELRLANEKGILYADTMKKNDLKKGSSYAFTFEYGILSSASSKIANIRVTGRV